MNVLNTSRFFQKVHVSIFNGSDWVTVKYNVEIVRLNKLRTGFRKEDFDMQ